MVGVDEGGEVGGATDEEGNWEIGVDAAEVKGYDDEFNR